MIKVGRMFREQMVTTVKESVEKRGNSFLVNFDKLDASQMTGLRKDLYKKNADMYVTRNSIVKIALKDLECDSITQNLEGQTAVVSSDQDVAEISKALVEFAKTHEGFVVRGGILDGAILEEADVKRISDLPSKEELFAKILATIQGPGSGLARVLNAKTREIQTVLKQLSEKTEEGSN